MLSTDTEIDRKLSLLILVPLLLCAFFVALVSFGAAKLEFGYASWVRHTHYLPAITAWFRDVYCWVWGLPAVLLLWCAALVRRPFCRLGAIMVFAGTESVLLTVWTLFTILSFYLGNQTFVAGSP